MLGVSICVHVAPRFVERHTPARLLAPRTPAYSAVVVPLLNIAISTFGVLAEMPVRLFVTFVHVAPASSLRKMPTVLTAAKNRFGLPGSPTRSLIGPADRPFVPDTSVYEAPVLVLRNRPLPLLKMKPLL